MSDAPRRDGRRTRARISEVATALFLSRGFDQVTIAEVAAASGVSKVTVFSHFARKEDLLFDRAPEASELIHGALLDRPAGQSAVDALRRLALDLLEREHPLSGLDPASPPFMRTIAESPALTSRAREIAFEIEDEVGDLLAAASEPLGDPRVLAALVMGAYRTVFVETSRRMLEGGPRDELVGQHRLRLEKAFDAVDAAARSLAAER